MNIDSQRNWMIFAKDGQYGKMYTIGISSKKQDGTYETSYMPVRFRKEIDLEDKTLIQIKAGWLIPLKDNKVGLFINEFAKVGKVNQETTLTKEDTFNPNEVVLTDDELPF